MIAVALAIFALCAAGALADAVLSRQEALGLARVYAPKTYGAWSLRAGCSVNAVNTLVFFSSVAALFGGTGQANYAAANACLDASAAHHRAHGGTATRGLARA